MRARFIAFCAVILLIGGLPALWSAGYRHRLETKVNSAALVPPKVGAFVAGERWRLPERGLSGIEQGASYTAPAEPLPVQFDMFIGALNVHNGIECYVARGSTIVWQTTERFTSADSQPVFNLALVRDDSIAGSALKLVGATACGALRCDQEPVVTRGFEFTRPGVLQLFGLSDHPVPISITILSGSGAETASGLKGIFADFVRSLDLTPHRTYSHAQS